VIRTTPQALIEEGERIFRREYQKMCQRTDRLIALVMAVQWPGAVIAAVLIGPRTWNGGEGTIHPHVVAAIWLGGLLTVLPLALAYLQPGRRSTRHAMATCQMLMSALLIHITGGRIETHFHVFGSLAFLAFYLDWQVLVTATVVTLVDHAVMGYYAPSLIFGTTAGSTGRLLEHVLWVVFCDVFLITSCVQRMRALRVMTEREAEQEVLLFQAYHDLLTGLGNRLLAQRELDRLLARPASETSFALVAIDLDRFKEVNDNLGHQAGDALLMEMGRRLQAAIGDGDTLVRMGGDEFVLIIENCAEERIATATAQRILDCVAEPFESGAHHFAGVGASIGICLYPTGAKNMEDLFLHADLALYKVKERGRNQYVVFDEAMLAEAQRKTQLENRVRTAVKENLFTLHYQPIVDTEGVLLGFETLLRWNDPVLGTVGPQVFVPVAERCGLIVALGRWVLEQACRQAAEWHALDGKGVKMSVNVSSVQLAHPEFVPMVMRTLLETGLPPELLDLELTETMLVERGGGSGDSLRRLRSLGVRLSIDDFGTGYSSLSYLRDLPVHRLKIDRAFVREIVTSEEARALLLGMIEMGRTLHLRVLAEGVETVEQMEILRNAGCDEIQGFLISKAVPAEAARRLLEQARLLPRVEGADILDGRTHDGGEQEGMAAAAHAVSGRLGLVGSVARVLPEGPAHDEAAWMGHPVLGIRHVG